MTKKQRREHKIGNQQRKAENIRLAKYADPRDRWYYATMRHVQDGKHTVTS